MGMFAFGLERLGLIAVAWPRAVLALLSALTLLALYGATNVRLDDELRRLFRSDAPVYQTYVDMLKAFSSAENQLFLLVESDRPMRAERLQALRNLHLDLQFIDGVATVFSVFSLRHPPVGSEPPAPLLPADLPQGAALDNLLDQARAHPLLGGKLISADARTALIIVSLATKGSPGLTVEAVLADIAGLTAAAGAADGLEIVLTGAIAVRDAIVSTLRRDLVLLTLLGTIVATVVCTIFFRRWRLVLIGSLPPVISVVWLIGGFGLFGMPITSINNVLPTLVLVIAFSDTVHLVQALRRSMADALPLGDAMRLTVIEVGPACAMTSVTTMIACLSLAWSESEPIREFAVGGGAAVFAAYVAVIMMTPALSVVLLRDDTPGIESDDLVNRMLAAASLWLGRRVMAAATPIAAISVPALILTGALYFRVETDHDYRSFLVPTSPANLAIDRINEKLGGADSVHVLIRPRSAEQAGIPPVVAAVHDAVAAVPEFANVISAASIARWWGNAGSQPLPARLDDRLRSPDGSAWLVTAYMPATPAAETRARLAGLEQALDPVRRSWPNYEIRATGIVAVSALASDRLIDGLKQSLALAVVFTVAVVALSVSSLVLALAAAVPTLLSLTTVGAALYLAGSHLEIPSVLALTIAFGVAVDNSIHVINRYRVERRTAPLVAALIATSGKVGPVLFAATFILSLGMGVTWFSSLPMIRLFGSLCVVVLLIAVLVSLVVLPALISSSSKRLPQL